jgi:hypothetical protein
MVLWNLLDGGLSCSRPLLGPSESMRGGTWVPILIKSTPLPYFKIHLRA